MLAIRVDAHGLTRIRYFESIKYPAPEYTGFVEFDRFIFFCVMFSPTEVANRNLRKSWPRLFGQNFHGDKWSPAGVALSTVASAEGPFRP